MSLDSPSSLLAMKSSFSPFRAVMLGSRSTLSLPSSVLFHVGFIILSSTSLNMAVMFLAGILLIFNWFWMGVKERRRVTSEARVERGVWGSAGLKTGSVGPLGPRVGRAPMRALSLHASRPALRAPRHANVSLTQRRVNPVAPYTAHGDRRCSPPKRHVRRRERRKSRIYE